MTEYRTRTAIRASDFNPNLIASRPEDERKVLLGTLFGYATRTVIRKSQDGEDSFEGLGGLFRFIPGPLQPSKDGLQASVLWLPGEMDEDIKEAIRAAQEAGDKAPRVEIAVNVYSVRANNAAKRSWELEHVIPIAADPTDPLALLEAKIKGTAALPAPAKAEGDAPAPEGKPKGK